jgi:tetratricopeptide (TPR) repeat protein
MSKKTTPLIIAIFFCFLIDSGFAWDWKSLHEKADRQTLPEAQVAVKAGPDSVEDLYILGLVCLNLHRDSQAEEIFGKILRLKPDSLEAKWALAEVLRRQHNLKEASQQAGQVIKANPDFSPAYITLAYIKYTQRDFAGAARIAGKVLRQGHEEADLSNRVRAHLLFSGAKGMIAHYGGPISKIINGPGVLSHLRIAQRMQPDSAAVFYGLGSFYLFAPKVVGGDVNKAEEYLKSAVDTDSLFANAYVRLGQLYGLKGDREKYRFYLDKALEIDPQNDLALDIKSGRCNFICFPETK